MSGIERLAKTISADMERRLPGQRKTQRSQAIASGRDDA
jgi:hypothetical protein